MFYVEQLMILLLILELPNSATKRYILIVRYRQVRVFEPKEKFLLVDIIVGNWQVPTPAEMHIDSYVFSKLYRSGENF